jgi:ABC-type sugar transport system ATPase subunit
MSAPSAAPPIAPPIASLRGIVRGYPGVRAVDGVDLDLRPGEILGLVGKNGAGKSTLMKILSGVQPADAGTIQVDGRPVPAHYTPADSRRLGIAVVHQELEIVPHLSAAENIALGAGYPRRRRVPLAVDRPTLRRRARQLLDGLHPGTDPDIPAGELSPARQRLVMIARGLYREARVIVLDEPSAALNEEEIATLHTVVRRLASQGRAVVYITHRLQEVLDLTDRVVVMRDGTVVDDRPTPGTARRELVAAITGKRGADDAARRPVPLHPGGTVVAVRGLGRDGALHDVGFDIRSGEVLGIAGLVGSGRTELARLLAGADRPTAGSITVRGRGTRLRSPRDALAAGIALIPEDRRNEGLVLGFGTRFNVTLATLARHRFGRFPRPSRRSEERATAEAGRRLRLTAADTERPVALLSGGNQQKVVIAKWLERHPDVLIFDEPTQGIDVEAKAEALALARSLAEQGSAVVLVASDFSELVSTCDRVIVLREGRLCGELAGADVSETAIVELCYRDAFAPRPA